MPNRILRDWTDSKTMNNLSWQEEVLFTRLIMKADDYGNFHADASLIKSLLFPRKDGIRANDIDGWLTRLEAAQLIRRYPAKGDTFLNIRNFGQRLDRAKRKFPQEPPETVTNESVVADNEPPPETNPNPETNPESRNETNGFAGENFTKIPPSLAMIEKMFLEANLTGAEEFFNEVEGRMGWANVNNWQVYTLAGISKRLKNLNNGKQAGSNSNRYRDARASVDAVKHLANEILRQPERGDSG